MHEWPAGERSLCEASTSGSRSVVAYRPHPSGLLLVTDFKLHAREIGVRHCDTRDFHVGSTVTQCKHERVLSVCACIPYLSEEYLGAIFLSVILDSSECQRLLPSYVRADSIQLSCNKLAEAHDY